MKTTHLNDINENTFQCKAADIQARTPIDFPIQLSSTMPWSIDYKNRKHLFIWSPNLLTLSLEDYGVLTLNSNIWHNIEFPAGMKIFASNITNPVYAFVKATDEQLIDSYVSTVSLPTSSTGTITTVPASASTVTLLAANVNRKGYRVFNDSTSIMYLAEAAGASTTAYTTQVPANSLWESPVTPVYTGIVTAVWASATGNARITEMS